MNTGPVFRRLHDDLFDDIFLCRHNTVRRSSNANGSMISQELQQATTLLQNSKAWQEKRRRETDGGSGNSKLLRENDCGSGKLDTGRRTFRDERTLQLKLLNRIDLGVSRVN